MRNLEPTISINHNWTNAFSLCNMWSHLQRELGLVERELQDCVNMEGWHQQCQVMVEERDMGGLFVLHDFVVDVLGCAES